jgi:hypothetical protein
MQLQMSTPFQTQTQNPSKVIEIDDDGDFRASRAISVVSIATSVGAKSIHSIHTQKLLETLSQTFAGSNTRDLIAHAANLTKKAFPFNFPATQLFSQTLPLMSSTVSIAKPKSTTIEPTKPIPATIVDK